MIKYNTLKIEGSNLIIDIETDTETSEYWENLDLISIDIDTSKTYLTGTHMDTIHSKDAATIKAVVPISGASDELFIITPNVANIPMDTPCGMDVPDVGVVYNNKKLTERGIGFLRELKENCTLPKGLIDFILKKYAIDMSIATCNYSQAAKYYRMLMNNPVKVSGYEGCGCNK